MNGGIHPSSISGILSLAYAETGSLLHALRVSV
jgi:hypothetical protein